MEKRTPAGYEIASIGALDDWRSHFGGFTPVKSRDGRRIVDHELAMQYIGLSANALKPREEAGYWHSHARIEEFYMFLEGEGEMGLDDDIVQARAALSCMSVKGCREPGGSYPTVPGNYAGCVSAPGASLCRTRPMTVRGTKSARCPGADNTGTSVASGGFEPPKLKTADLQSEGRQVCIDMHAWAPLLRSPTIRGISGNSA